MASRLQIYQQATIHLGESRVNTIVDDTETRRVLDDAWNGVLAEAFLSGDWNFAKANQLLVADATVSPARGYAFAYDYPSDYLRTTAVSPDANFVEPFNDYVDIGEHLHSDQSVIFLEYIRSDLRDDDNVDEWPDYFWRYVAYLLAFEVCERLTQSSGKSDELFRRTRRSLSQAKSIDGINEQGRSIRNSEWLRAQRGSYARNNRQRNTLTLPGQITLGEGDV